MFYFQTCSIDYLYPFLIKVSLLLKSIVDMRKLYLRIKMHHVFHRLHFERLSTVLCTVQNILEFIIWSSTPLKIKLTYSSPCKTEFVFMPCMEPPKIKTEYCKKISSNRNRVAWMGSGSFVDINIFSLHPLFVFWLLKLKSTQISTSQK